MPRLMTVNNLCLNHIYGLATMPLDLYEWVLITQNLQFEESRYIEQNYTIY